MMPWVIAEPGCTHEGQLEVMLDLIDAAAKAGCDAFKNQYHGNPDEVRRRRHSDYASYNWLHYPLEWHAICRAKCHALGLLYGCSTNLAEDVAAVDPFVDFHKRPSFEHGDRAWLEAAKATEKPYYVSAGMLDEKSLHHLTESLSSLGRVLQCVSAYPTPAHELQLETIRLYRLDGLSDHSHMTWTGGLAVAAGARVLEVHMRPEPGNPQNPDYAVAFSPNELKAYVQFARLAAFMLGSGTKQIQPSEAPMLRYRV